MTLFRDELLTVQDEYLRVDTHTMDPEEDDDVDYSNDDLGENTEITPLGDDIEDSFKVGPGDDDDDLLDDDDDLLLDDEELEDENDNIVDSHTIKAIGDDDDDLLDDDDDDDLFDDDDEIENPDVIPVVPDDDEDDEVWTDDEDDDLLDDEEDLDDDTGSTTAGMNTGFGNSSRSTSNIVDHEPGTISGRDI